jgi:uncharacterized protein YkwD
MSRWSLVVALSVVACVGIGVAGEGTAAADCSVPRSARVRPVHRHAGREVPPAVQPGTGAGGTTATADSFELYNLERVNAYRRAGGLPPLRLDPTLTSFAREGSVELTSDHVPHRHFASAGDSLWHRGFTGNASENQGSNTGWPRAAADPGANEQQQIDQILASMMREGPRGGHYANMMSPKAKRIGIGLVEDATGKLYLTNDFSE